MQCRQECSISCAVWQGRKKRKKGHCACVGVTSALLSTTFDTVRPLSKRLLGWWQQEHRTCLASGMSSGKGDTAAAWGRNSGDRSAGRGWCATNSGSLAAKRGRRAGGNKNRRARDQSASRCPRGEEGEGTNTDGRAIRGRGHRLIRSAQHRTAPLVRLSALVAGWRTPARTNGGRQRADSLPAAGRSPDKKAAMRRTAFEIGPRVFISVCGGR